MADSFLLLVLLAAATVRGAAPLVLAALGGLFAERSGGTTLSLRRGFTLSAGERVLVVEDVFTTGKSTRETMDVVRDAGAEVVGAAAIIDRSGGAITFGVPHKTVIQLALPMYGPDECPLCKQGLPVTKPGSRPT